MFIYIVIVLLYDDVYYSSVSLQFHDVYCAVMKNNKDFVHRFIARGRADVYTHFGKRHIKNIFSPKEINKKNISRCENIINIIRA